MCLEMILIVYLTMKAPSRDISKMSDPFPLIPNFYFMVRAKRKGGFEYAR